MLKLSPTQIKIYDLLKDRRPHRIIDIVKHLDNPDITKAMLKNHMSLLRRKLKGYGETVMCEVVGETSCYRLVDHINDF